jgi:hypothetical protein
VPGSPGKCNCHGLTVCACLDGRGLDLSFYINLCHFK